MTTEKSAPRRTDPESDQGRRAAQRGRGVVVSLPFVGNDEALLEGLREGHLGARAVFCDRHGERVLRVLARILGADDELMDLHQEVSLRALRSVAKVRSAGALSGWITTIAVNVARSELGRRRRRRWLTPLAQEELPEGEAAGASEDDREALRRTYAIFDRLSPDLRIPLALRLVDGMELREVASACGLSLATVKRRLARAEAQFRALARRDPILGGWLDRRDRWGDR